MTIKALVVSDRPDDYTGKKGLVKQQIITVMNVSDTGERLVQPIEYALSDEEKSRHAGKLQDKVINISFREFIPFGLSCAFCPDDGSNRIKELILRAG